MGSPISLKQLITVVFCPPWLSFTKIYVGILTYGLYIEVLSMFRTHSYVVYMMVLATFQCNDRIIFCVLNLVMHFMY